MRTTVKGHKITQVTDGPKNIDTALTALSRSVADLPGADSLTKANQIADEATAWPVHVWRTDLHAHHVKETPAGKWMQSGGQDFYCEAEVARSMDNGETADLHVDGFNLRSEGWAVSGGGIVIPSTGMWTLEIYGRMDGILSTTPGRRFFSYRVDSKIHNQKFHIPDDSSGGGSSTKLIRAGQTVWFRCFNGTGARRAVYADVTIFKVGDPRIVG